MKRSPDRRKRGPRRLPRRRAATAEIARRAAGGAEREGLEVHFADRQKTARIDRSWYRRLALYVLRSEGVRRAELGVAFVDNLEMRRLNRRFLGHDYATDVVTFPLEEDEGSMEGQIVISREFAESYAARRGGDGRVEAGLYLVHGILHLCGYDDRQPAARTRMHRRQAELLDGFLKSAAGGRRRTTKLPADRSR